MIAFATTDAGVVTSSASAAGDVAKAAEVILLALYSGHVFADIGQKPWAVEFSAALGGMDADELATFAGNDTVTGVRLQSAAEADSAPVSFAARLRRPDAIGPDFFKVADQDDWNLKVRMPWRARRHSNHYFAKSVALLLHHFLRANASDEVQRGRLVTAARLIAELHAGGYLGLPIRWSWAAAEASEHAWSTSPAQG